MRRDASEDARQRHAGLDPQSVQHVDQVFGREVARRRRARTGSRRARRRTRRTSRRRSVQRVSTFASAVPRVSWKCSAIALERHARARRPRARVRTWPGCATPIVSLTATSYTPMSSSARRDSRRPCRAAPRPRTGSRTPSTDSRARACPAPRARSRRRPVGGERLVDRLVDVRAAERLGGGREDRDLVEAGRGGALEAGQVRHQRGVARARRAARCAANTLGRVGHLRHPLRAHERRDLDDRQARAALSASMNATLSAVAIVAASFCRPSRGPTSTTVTRRPRSTAQVHVLLQLHEHGARLDEFAVAAVHGADHAVARPRGSAVPSSSLRG